MFAMDRPNCGLVNHPSATRCDCDYDFFEKTVKRSFLNSTKVEDANAKNNSDIAIGLGAIVIGLLGFAYRVVSAKNYPRFIGLLAIWGLIKLLRSIRK